MGQEILHKHFKPSDYELFSKNLKMETNLLNEMSQANKFSNHSPVGGFEIEGCLIDSDFHPAPLNQEFLTRLNNPLVTSELAKFNIELNNVPRSLSKKVFTLFENDLHKVFKDADKVAEELNTRVLLTGILPTLLPEDLSLQNMTNLKRYHALNDVVLKARGNKPLLMDITGNDHLKLTHNSVMMESTTTSFQVHMQTPYEQSHHYYNAAIIASAPIIAIAANSPFLFGKQLWHETRIPVFEQAIVTPDKQQRVSFGSGFAEQSIIECFNQNQNEFPPLLPMIFDDKPEKFKHVSLHNGVIWRWNRPLIGFDEDGTPHVRIEHRILPAGPTIKDMIANAVFFYGITQSLVKKSTTTSLMTFEQAKNNFYQTAKNGLNTKIYWAERYINTKMLILDTLLPLAREGLNDLNIDSIDIDYYLDIINKRTESGQTGAEWQIQHMKYKNCTVKQLTKDYLHHQHLDLPVHTWSHR